MINFPNYKNLFDSFVASFKEQKPDIDPTVNGSWSMAFGKGVSAVGFSGVLLVKQLLKQFFPQTATGFFLDLWGGYDDLERLDPSTGVGNIAVTGLDLTIIPANETWIGSNGVLYSNSSSATIEDQTIVLLSIIWASGVVTAKSSSPHGLASGMTVNIVGAVEVGFDGAFQILVTSEDEFTYSVVSVGATPATGPFEGNATFASLYVQAQSDGANTNLNSGSVLTYQGVIVGIDPTSNTDFYGLQGGADEETTEAFRSRILLSRSSQEGVFTETQIELACLLINGNTRVYIQTPNTDNPLDPDPILPGQIRVYILRDNDSPITPSPSVLALTKKSVIENGKLPASQWEEDVEVLAPVLLDIDFTFTTLSPNTGTMRNAIQAQLNAYFTDEVLFGTDIDEDILRGVIIQTQDLTTGQFIESFDFTTSPASVGGLIPVGIGELPVAGAYVWP